MQESSHFGSRLLTLALLVCSPAVGLGAGFRLPDQDAFATARGEAFAATADNPSAIYYNPAGLTQLEGWHTRGGVYTISLQPSYRAPGGGKFRNQTEWHAVPQLFTAYGPEKLPLAFGLGLYAPYGLGIKWPQDTGFRSLALQSKLKYMTLNPVIAWEVLPTLSLGGGPTVNYSKTDLSQGLFPAPGNDLFRFKGDDMDVGYNLGLRWQPSPKIAFGAAYRSKTTMAYEGYTDMIPFAQHMDASLRFPFPQNFVLGVSYRPTEKWNFEFNADFTDWSRLNHVSVNQAPPIPLLPGTVPMTLNWESCWYYEFGVTRYLDKGWQISGGYVLNENCMPDANFTPLVAEQTRHFFSLGAGYQGKRLGFDIAYQLGYGPTRTVSGSPGGLADGEWDFVSHAVSVSLNWRF